MVSPYSVLVWRTIRNIWGRLSKHVVYKVGDGTKICSGRNPGIGKSLWRLCSLFFSTCSNHEATGEDSWTPKGWTVCFRRNLNDWDIDRVVGLLKGVYKFRGTSPAPDAIKWKHSSDGRFYVTVYTGSLGKPGGWTSPWTKVLKYLFPSKIKWFTL